MIAVGIYSTTLIYKYKIEILVMSTITFAGRIKATRKKNRIVSLGRTRKRSRLNQTRRFITQYVYTKNHHKYSPNSHSRILRNEISPQIKLHKRRSRQVDRQLE